LVDIQDIQIVMKRETVVFSTMIQKRVVVIQYVKTTNISSQA
jgi:hypothetical protein